MIQVRLPRVPCGTTPLLVLLAIMCGCSEKDPVEPKGNSDPTYYNVWPAAAGRYWEYDTEELVYDEGLSIYERVEDLPPIPSMEELYADLQAHSAGAVNNSSLGIYRLEFVPEATSSRDSLVLVVESAMEFIEGYAWPPYPLIYSYDVKILWTRTEERIAAYSENGLSWLFLEGAIAPGNEFETLLLENLDYLEQEISLKTRVWRIGPIDLPGESYPNGVECLYVLDQGYLASTGPDGEITGYSRIFNYGLIVYVPGIGPVFCKEKSLQPGWLVEHTAKLRSYG